MPGTLLKETVFFHAPSRTLISSDLVENFETSPHWPTRIYLAALQRVLAWDFDRIVLAHGDVLAERGPEVLRESYSWL